MYDFDLQCGCHVLVGKDKLEPDDAPGVKAHTEWLEEHIAGTSQAYSVGAPDLHRLAYGAAEASKARDTTAEVSHPVMRGRTHISSITGLVPCMGTIEMRVMQAVLRSTARRVLLSMLLATVGGVELDVRGAYRRNGVCANARRGTPRQLPCT